MADVKEEDKPMFVGQDDKVVESFANFDVLKSVIDSLKEAYGDNPSAGTALSFSPSQQASDYNAIYRPRTSLIPYEYSKQISNADDLLHTILNQLGHKVSLFCRPRIEKHELGYTLIVREKSKFKALPIAKQRKLLERAKHVSDLLYHCGYVDDDDVRGYRPKLPEFIKLIIHDGLLYGWSSTEIIRDTMDRFYCFKPVDSGTIYLSPINTVKSVELAKKAFFDLKEKHGANMPYIEALEKVANGDPAYQYLQVIDGLPYTAFTSKKLLVEQLYPSLDIADAGYPRPPIDSMYRSLATHSNVTTRSSLIFTYGRASKGFFLIKSSNLQENILQRLRQQMSANINGAERSWRIPVFSVGPTDSIEFKTMDEGSSDQFEYLSEITSRVLMAAFGVSPEEIPAYNHLVSAAPGQTIPETDSFFSLTYGKGSGLRTCVQFAQNVINKLIIEMDAEVAEFFRFKFCGMDEDSPSKRLARASQEINLYANLDEILFDFDHHEGAPIGGNIPLNPQWLNVLPQAYSQNQIAYSLGNQAALTDPTLFYYKDPNWFSFLNAFPTMLNDREKVSFLLNTYLNELMDLFLIGK